MAQTNEYLRRREVRVNILDDAGRLVDQLQALNDQDRTLATTVNPNNSERQILAVQIKGLEGQLEKLAGEWFQTSSPTSEQVASFKQKAKRADRRDERQERRAEKTGPEQAEATKQRQEKSDTSASLDAYRAEINDYLVEKNTATLVIQNFLEARPALVPSDLLGGNRQQEAIRIAFKHQPHLAAMLLSQLAEGHESPVYADATETLQSMKKTLDEHYDELSKVAAAKEALEKATLQGSVFHKAKEIMGDIVKSPVALAAFGAASIGLIMLYRNAGEDTKKTIKSWLGWGAAGTGALFLGDFVWDRIDPKHRGIWDMFGLNPHAITTPELLAYYRQWYTGMPTEDQDAIDDVVQLITVDMPSINHAFADAVRNNTKEVDPNLLLSGGLESAQARGIQAGSLYEGLAWFYKKAYEKGQAEGEIPVKSTEQEILLAGIAYADKHWTHHQFYTASYELFRDSNGSIGGVAGAPAGPGATPKLQTAPEITDGNLNRLRGRSARLNGLLIKASTGTDLYFISGVPFKYRYDTDSKTHYFVLAQGGTLGASSDIPESLEADALEAKVRAMVSEAEGKARTKLEAQFGKQDSAGNDIHYEYKVFGDKGAWVIEPPLARKAYQGLKNYKSELKVSVIVVVDSNGNYKLALDHNNDFIPDDGTKYATAADIDTLKADFERLHVAPELVKKDAGHLLLTLGYSVVDIKDVPPGGAETVVTIRSNNNYEGILTYENGVVKTLTITDSAKHNAIDKDPAMVSLWQAESRKEVTSFFAREDVKTELEKFTRVFMQREGITGQVDYYLSFAKEAVTWVSDNLESLVFGYDEEALDRKFKSEGEKEFVKQIIAKQRALEGEIMALYQANYLEVRFSKEKEDLQDKFKYRVTEIETIRESVRDTTVLSDTRDIETMKKKGVERIEAKLDPMDPSFTDPDEIRKVYVQERRAYYTQELDRRITALGASPTRAQIEGVITALLADVNNEARAYMGAPNYQARKQLNERVLSGANEHKWKAEHDLVFTYLSSSYKWEQFCFLSNPKNFRQLMEIFEQDINRGNYAEVSGAPVRDYTFYWLNEVYILLGGHQDFSLDRFYGRLNSVSDTAFEAKLGQLTLIKDYEAWRLDATIDKRPAPPDLTMAYQIEKAKDVVVDGFMDDFEKNFDLSRWLRFDGEWPTFFRNHVQRRIRVDIEPSCSNVAQLQTKLVEFRQFVKIEEQFYDYIITGKVEGNDRQYYSVFSLAAAGLGLVISGGNPLIAGGAGLTVGLLENFFDDFGTLTVGVNAGSTFHAKVQAIIDKSFQANFVSSISPNPQAHAQAMSKDLFEVIRQAEKSDARSYNLGPIAFGGFTGIDPFQVSP